MRRLYRTCLAVGATVLLTSPAAAWALGGTIAPGGAAGAGPIAIQYAGPGFGGPYGGPGADEMEGDPGQGRGVPGGGQGFRGGPGQQGRNAFPTGRFVVYHGFKIDVGEAEGRVDLPSALKALDHQIDIVDRSGLSGSLLQTFRSVPIRISVTFTGSGGHYKGGQEVVMGSLAANDDRPVLLHEYMHVMHYKRFPGGFQNPTIRHFYDEAWRATCTRRVLYADEPCGILRHDGELLSQRNRRATALRQGDDPQRAAGLLRLSRSALRPGRKRIGRGPGFRAGGRALRNDPDAIPSGFVRVIRPGRRSAVPSGSRSRAGLP